jgi:D-sedoheptulose 7-phosphate isomerase
MSTDVTSLVRLADRQVLTSLDAIERLRAHVPVLVCWSQRLVEVLGNGGRLLVAGNGGSAAHAQHLTSEMVGRFCTDRPAFSALCLSAESSSVTAIANDFGYDRTFARQVEAHARPDDVLVLLSTSGRSANLLAASAAAHRCGARVWALTGPQPNPLAGCADEVVAVDAASTAAVQDAHQVALHVLCAVFDATLGS